MRPFLLSSMLAIVALTTGCGEAQIVTPEPLRIVDTYPGHGSVVPRQNVPVAVLFSAPVDVDTVPEALVLEETSESGTSIRVVPTALAEYLRESHTATFQSPSLDADTAYRITVRAEVLRGEEGSTLVTDFVRRFKTLP